MGLCGKGVAHVIIRFMYARVQHICINGIQFFFRNNNKNDE